MGQTGKAPLQATLSTSAHTEYERDQGRVTPCYPAGRWFWHPFGQSSERFKIAFFGHILNQPKLRMHVRVECPA